MTIKEHRKLHEFRAAKVGAIFAAAVMAAPLARADDIPADCSASEIPDAPVVGSIGGAPFELWDAGIGLNGVTGINGVEYDAYRLSLTLTDAENRLADIGIAVIVEQGAQPDGRTFVGLPEGADQPEAGPGAPALQGWSFESEPLGIDASFVFEEATLRVEFGQRTDDGLPVRLIFCAPDIGQTSVAGRFDAPFDE